MKRTGLLLTINCKTCKQIYFASCIFGGIALDEDSTMEIADAYEKGDEIQLLNNVSVKMGMCSCEETK